MARRRRLYRDNVAELIGVKTDTLNRYDLPERDGTDIDRGHARPWWWSSTIRKWHKARRGSGNWGPRNAA